jgi:hypothetical protein
MKIDKEKKAVAPDEVGELPNEHRCPRCWGLLSQTVTNGKTVLWCINCNTIVQRRTG